MKFSIIVPVYQVEKYLPTCIESVLRQTFTDFELILVDDGSPDNSKQICEKYAASDKRVCCISRPNGGLSAARNTGIHAAKGDYLIFLDSDDYWLNKNGLELVDKALSESSAEAAFWLYRKVEEDCNAYDDGIPGDFSVGDPDGKTGLIPFIREKRLVACAWDVAVSRSLFEEGTLDFEPGVYSEDVEWLARLLMKAEHPVFLKLVMNAYRLRGDSITKTISEKNTDDLTNHYRKISHYIDNADEETSTVLKAYLGEQAANFVLALALSKPEVVQKYKNCTYIRYIRYCQSKRARAVKTAVNLSGVSATVSLIKKIKRL